jgi:hypothetical protein
MARRVLPSIDESGYFHGWRYVGDQAEVFVAPLGSRQLVKLLDAYGLDFYFDAMLGRDEVGRFTARCENRKGHFYWWAFKRINGKLYKAYLGRAEDITLQSLATAAATIVNKAYPPLYDRSRCCQGADICIPGLCCDSEHPDRVFVPVRL